MVETSLGINFSSSDGLLTESPWIRLEQVIISDTATKKEVADLLDDLFDIQPCDPVENTDAKETPSEEEFVEKVKTHFSMDMCNLDGASNYRTFIRVYRSNFLLPYTLRLTNGQINTTKVVSELVKGSILVEGKSSIILDYPIKRGTTDITIKWNSLPVSDSGVRYSPTITRTGNVLSWGEEVTGTIYYEYTTEYEEVEVVVYGKDDLTVGDCLAIAFYEGTYYELELSPPDDTTEDLLKLKEKYCDSGDQLKVKEENHKVTCYIEVYEKWLCECSGKEAYHVEYEREVDCPEGMKCSGLGVTECRSYLYSTVEIGGYVSCGESDPYLQDSNYYEEKCCEKPPFALPACKETTSLMKATSEGRLSEETKKKYTDKYDNVEFIPVWPEDNICGELTTTQVMKARSCCDEVPTEVLIDRSTVPETLPHGESVTIYASGGKLPYTWKPSNNQLKVNGESLIITEVPWVEITATDDFCGRGVITLTDGCSTDSVIVMSDLGYWEYIGNACGLPNEVRDSITNSTAVVVKDGLKQVEIFKKYVSWWPGSCIYCYECPQYVVDDPPHCLPSFEDFLALMEAHRPINGYTNTCLHSYELLRYYAHSYEEDPIYTYPDGSFIYNTTGSCSFHCDKVDGNGYAFGSTSAKSAIAIPETTLKLYRWSC